jgi:hypothetical protein
MLGAWRGFPMQGLRARAATEDIETVLSRFQAWTGSRTPKLAEDGVRELSYEEALETSRYRWKGREELQLAAKPAPEDPLAANTNTEDKLRAEPGVVPVAPPEPSVPQGAPEEAPFEDTSEPEFTVIAPESVQETAPQTTVKLVRKASRRRQPFDAVLAQSAGVPGSSLARTWGSEERQVSMSLRVAASEQALIKIRAAEAGVSASAYLRQCALEVEILRAQVQQLMAASVRSWPRESRRSPAAESSSRGNGWLSRLRQRIWTRRSSELSLRA